MDESTAETNPWQAVYDAIVADALQSLQVVYDEFNVSLQEWLNDILNHPIFEDWREEVARFVQQTERNGLEILPESIRSIEAIIESCIAGTDEFAEFGPAPRGPAAESAPHFVVSIAPEVSGPPPGQQPASSEWAPRSTEELKIRARQLSYAFQKQLGLTDAERALVEEYFVRVLATGVAEPLPKFVQDKLDERARKIAAQQDQPGLVADTRTDRQRRVAELRVLQDKSHTPGGLTLAERNRLQDLLEIAIVDQAVDIHETQGMLGLLFNPASFVNIDNLAILATPFAKGATPIDPLAGQTGRNGSQAGQTTAEFEPNTGKTIMKPGARAQFRPGSPEPTDGPDSLPTKPQAPGTSVPQRPGFPEPAAAKGVGPDDAIPEGFSFHVDAPQNQTFKSGKSYIEYTVKGAELNVDFVDGGGAASLLKSVLAKEGSSITRIVGYTSDKLDEASDAGLLRLGSQIAAQLGEGWTARVVIIRGKRSLLFSR